MTPINSSTTLSLMQLGLLSAIIPLGILLAWIMKNRKKEKVKLVPFFAGILAYMLFGYVLRTLVDGFAMGFKNPFSDFLNNNIIAAAAFVALVAAVLEESGKYFVFGRVFKKSLKQYTSPKDAITFGIGFGALECIMTLGVQFIQFHIIATLINDGTFEKTMEAYKKAGDTATVEQMKSVAESLTHITPVSATLFAVDRIAFFFIQIALCVLIYKGVHKKLKKYLIFSMVLHLASYCVFYFSSGTDSMGLNGIIEVIALVVTIAIIYVAYVNFSDIKKVKPENEDEKSAEKTDDNSKENSEGNSQNKKTDNRPKKTSISDIAKGRYDIVSDDKEK